MRRPWLVALLVSLAIVGGMPGCNRLPRKQKVIMGAPPASISDPALKSALESALHKTTDPTSTDLATLTALQIGPASDKSGFTSLMGLEHCTHLTTLIIEGRPLPDLAPIGSLTQLKGLNLNGDNLSDITPLKSLTNLEWLDLGENQIADLTPLAGMTKLKLLKLRGNKIVELKPLGGLTAIESLALSNNQIIDLGPLTTLIHLKELYLTHNPLGSLEPLAQNTGLSLNDRLVLDHTQVQGLEAGVNKLKGQGVQIVESDM